MKTKTTHKLITVSIALALMFSMASCAKTAPTAEDFISQGDKYLASGDYDKAEDAYTSAIKLNKKLTAAWLGRGDAYFGMEDYDSAIEDYEQVIDLDDELVDAYIKLADCYIELDDVEEAIRWLQEGYDITESSKLLRKLEKLKPDDAESSSGEKRGNTTGNIVNEGRVAYADGWVYYTDNEEDIFKMRGDGSEKQLVGFVDTKEDNNGDVYYLNVLGDWIYYSVGFGNAGIYRMRTDGTVTEQIVSENYECYEVSVVDDWVYYGVDDGTENIYRVRVDGSDKQQICEDYSYSINVADGFVYYVGDDDNIYRISVEGADKQQLNSDYSYSINVVDGFVYYANADEDYRLYRMRTDGSGRERIGDAVMYEEGFNVADGWVYYFNEDNYISRISIDGTNPEIVFDDYICWDFISIADGWLYFEGDSEADGLYRIKTNGTGLEAVTSFSDGDTGSSPPKPEKPVIYLYPERETEVSVALGIDPARFTVTYPEYNNGWSVIAKPDGTLIDKRDGNAYSYLFWEAEGTQTWSFDDGFIVKSSEAAVFLREKLSYMGLTPKEYNDFIVYWLPRLLQNEYNLVRFAGAEYTDEYPLNVSPSPDSVLRVFMVWKEANGNETIAPQELPRFDRQGFAVVEWGGAEVG